MIGLDAKAVVEFISKDDDPANPTIFLLGNISNREKLALFKDAVKSDGGIDMAKASEKVLDVFKVGVKGIKNLGGKDYELIDDAVMEIVPFKTVLEVANKILEINFLNAGEIKN